VNDNSGLFPITNVQLGFDDLPSLETTGNFLGHKKPKQEVSWKMFVLISYSLFSFSPISPSLSLSEIQIKTAHVSKPMKEVETLKFPFLKYAETNFRTQATKKTDKKFDFNSRITYSKVTTKEAMFLLSTYINVSESN
jgi:hypothetical protein